MLTPEATDYSNKKPRIRCGIPHPLEMLTRAVLDSPNSADSYQCSFLSQDLMVGSVAEDIAYIGHRM